MKQIITAILILLSFATFGQTPSPTAIGIKVFGIAGSISQGDSVISFGKNAANDSFILVLKDGRRFAVKDSSGGSAITDTALIRKIANDTAQSLKGLIDLRKLNSDSIGISGYTTLAQHVKTRDSLLAFLASKQNTLVSGTSIKTVNGNSLLGSGDIAISASGSSGISKLGISDSTLVKLNDSVYRANITVLKTVWQARQDSIALIGKIANNWGLKGNSGTNPATNFIGTTDDQPLLFRVNNQNAGIIDHIYGNAFYGNLSGNYPTIGGNNTGIGNYSLYSNTTGSANTGIGANSLISNTIGSANTGIGNYSLYSNTTGVLNTAIGGNSLISNTIGENNTAIGYNTGDGITTGSNNTILGANVFGLAGSLSNNIIIADGQGRRSFSADSLRRVTLNGYASRLFLSGDTTANKIVTMDVNGKLSQSYWPVAGGSTINGTGFVKATGTTISYDNNTYLTTSSAAATYQTSLGFTPYDATNPAGYISSVPAQTYASLLSKPTTSAAAGFTDVVTLTGNQTVAGVKTLSGFPILPATLGSILFAGTSGVISENNSKLFWDNTNTRMNIGGANAVGDLNVKGGAGGTRIISQINGTGAGDFADFAFYNTAGNVQAVFRANSVNNTGYGGINSVNFVNVFASPLTFATNNIVRLTVTALGSIGIGTTTTASSSILDVASTTQGSRPFPSMTTTQMTAIASPSIGLCVFNLDSSDICKYTGTNWRIVGTDYVLPSNNNNNANQDIISGTTTTITPGVINVFVDPVTLLSTHTITMPSSPQDDQFCRMFFGKAIVANAVVVTSLTIAANSGQSLYQSITPTQAKGGDYIEYQYKLSNTTWYRKN